MPDRFTSLGEPTSEALRSRLQRHKRTSRPSGNDRSLACVKAPVSRVAGTRTGPPVAGGSARSPVCGCDGGPSRYGGCCRAGGRRRRASCGGGGRGCGGAWWFCPAGPKSIPRHLPKHTTSYCGFNQEPGIRTRIHLQARNPANSRSLRYLARFTQRKLRRKRLNRAPLARRPFVYGSLPGILSYIPVCASVHGRKISCSGPARQGVMVP